jgi:hypothetical protein
MGYGCVNPELEAALDYHDHDHDFGFTEDKKRMDDEEVFSHHNFSYPQNDGGQFHEIRSMNVRRNFSSSVDETILSEHAARTAELLHDSSQHHEI